MQKACSTHIPVLLNEVLEALNVQPGGRYIDATTGGGGHSIGILERSDPNGRVLGIDADPTALELAEKRICLLYTSPSPRDGLLSRMPSSA